MNAPRVLDMGDGRILVALSLDDLEDLALQTSRRALAQHLILAIGLLDEEREERVRKDRAKVDGWLDHSERTP